MTHDVHLNGQGTCASVAPPAILSPRVDTSGQVARAEGDTLKSGQSPTAEVDHKEQHAVTVFDDDVDDDDGEDNSLGVMDFNFDKTLYIE